MKKIPSFSGDTKNFCQEVGAAWEMNTKERLSRLAPLETTHKT